MPIIRVAPNSDAVPNDWSGTTPHWDEVNDVVADDATTDVTSFTINAKEYFGLDISALDPKNRITAIEMEIRWSPGVPAGTWGLTPRFRIGGLDFNETELTATGPGAYQTDLINRNLNPAGGHRWTKDALRNLQIGFEQTTVQTGMPGISVSQAVLNVTTESQSKLQAIKDYLVEQTSRISGIGSFGTKLKAWHEVVNFPACYCAIGSETKTPAPTRSKEGNAQFIFPTVVKSEDPLDSFMEILEQLEEAIEDDPSLDTLALNAHVSGFNALITSDTIAGQVHVADILVDVIYRHKRGDA